MTTSRREFIKSAGTGLVTSALVAATTKIAFAQTDIAPSARAGDKEIDIINFDVLEQEAKSGRCGKTVALGRPVLYGLAVGGPRGVRSVIQHLRDELQVTMLLAGAKETRGLSQDYLRL